MTNNVNPQKQETETIIKEHGFRRLIIRKGKTKRQKTEIIQKNPMKVTLDKIGDLELYCYPFDYPDTVFIGLGEHSQPLNMYQTRQLFKFYNVSRWFLQGEWTKDLDWRGKPKRSMRTRGELKKAYNLGLERQKETKKHEKKR